MARNKKPCTINDKECSALKSLQLKPVRGLMESEQWSRTGRGGGDLLDAQIHFWYEGKMYNLVFFYGRRPMTLIRLISNQRFLKSSLGLIWKWSHWMRAHLGLIASLVVHPLAFFLILMLNHMCAPITSNAKVMEHIKGGGGSCASAKFPILHECSFVDFRSTNHVQQKGLFF